MRKKGRPVCQGELNVSPTFERLARDGMTSACHKALGRAERELARERETALLDGPNDVGREAARPLLHQRFAQPESVRRAPAADSRLSELWRLESRLLTMCSAPKSCSAARAL